MAKVKSLNKHSRRKRTNIEVEKCNRCGKAFNKDLFRFRKDRNYYAAMCLECEHKINHETYINNRKHVIARTTKNTKERLKWDINYRLHLNKLSRERKYTPEQYFAKQLRDRKNHQLHQKERNAAERKRYKDNPKVRKQAKLRGAKRRAMILRAAPSWVNWNIINSIYENQPRSFHVDHIWALKGKNFSGLHVPWNLQYLKAKLNLKKGNKSPEVFYGGIDKVPKGFIN